MGRAGVVREVAGLLRQAADHAAAGSDGWCTAQLWLGRAAQYSADLAAAFDHFTAVRDAVAGRAPSWALAYALAGRAAVLRLMGRAVEADGEGRRSLALAREIGDPVGELLALVELSLDADYAGDHDEAVRLARQAGQITAGNPDGLARGCSAVLTIVLADAGDLAEAALPWFAPRWKEQQRQARQVLGPGRARAAEDRGAAMSPATAAEYALTLTDPGPPLSAPGVGELSARERELARLVAQGRTNAQIAAELYISVRTVGSHLDRIRDKTGCRRRADMTRLALSMDLV